MKLSYNKNLTVKYILIALFLSGSQICYPAITATQMGMYDFQLNHSLTSDEMNGTIDVTAKLQAAVNAARDAKQTLFIPSGTYKISAQIVCMIGTEGGTGRPNIPVNIVGSAINHPVIKLADNTEAFKGALPKALFHLQFNNASYGTDWYFESGIRAIDIDLGTGNTNAVALYWGCAQYCFIEDINIIARDGFAGVTGFGGANSLLANISVRGGQHGIYLPKYNDGVTWGMKGSPQSSITGCIFTEQTGIPVEIWSWGGVTITGTTIITSSATAMKMNCDSDIESFPLSLIDSKIEFTSPLSSNCAIQNPNRGTVSLRGVYVKGAGTVCNNGSDGSITNAGQLTDWTHVKRYNYVSSTPKTPYGDPTPYPGVLFNAATGVNYISVADKIVAAPPADLTSRHIWATTPSFEDPDAVLVTTAEEIQGAINSNQKVCLARGTYILTSPITLKANTIFLGCPGRGLSGSILKYGWTPAQQTWLIETENSAAATTYLMDITTDPGNADYLGSLHWQAGRNSIIRTVRFDKSWDTYEKNLIRFYISGNGGGRVFNYQDEKSFSGDISTCSPSHRKLKVSGTSQPLIFYGLNLERGGSFPGESSFPLIEIENSSNIMIFGAKSETYQPYATINNSHNIFLTNIIDFANINKNLTKQNLIQITGSASDSIEITNVIFSEPPSSNYLLVDDPWNTNEPSRFTVCGLYSRNWSSVASGPLSGVGIRQPVAPEKSTFELYPNPVNNYLTIKLSGYHGTDKAQIYNINGTVVRDLNLFSLTQQLNVEDLPAGIYIVSLNHYRNQTARFIKQ